ncbi:MAG: hypothetical protein MUE94_09960 [Verrucomicrobia bacterium]|nr:hypothetical protein [Verrucomicrobiota bacterium]
MKPAEPVAPQVSVPALSGPQPDNAAQSKAREALRQEEPVEARPVTSIPEPEKPAKPTEPKPAVPQPQTVRLEEPMASPEAKPSERDEPKPVTAAPAKSKPQPRKDQSLTAGMQAPALPTTPQQQQALDALLQQYASDQISAAEYHSRRAEILGGK